MKVRATHDSQGYDGQTVAHAVASAWNANSVSLYIDDDHYVAGHLGEGRAGNGGMTGNVAASGVQRGTLMQRTVSLPPTSRESETIRLVEGIVVHFPAHQTCPLLCWLESPCNPSTTAL